MTKMLIFHSLLFHRPQRGFYTKEIYQEVLEEDWIGNIVSFGIAKYQIQRKAIKVLKIEKTGKIRMPPE